MAGGTAIASTLAIVAFFVWVLVSRSTPHSELKLMKVILPAALCMAIAILAAQLPGRLLPAGTTDYVGSLALMISFAFVYGASVLFGAGYWGRIKLLSQYLRRS